VNCGREGVSCPECKQRWFKIEREDQYEDDLNVGKIFDSVLCFTCKNCGFCSRVSSKDIPNITKSSWLFNDWQFTE
jgi:hypothetical protein